MSKHNNFYLLFGILATAYIVLTLKLPPTAATLTKFHLTAARAHVISLSVIIPYVLIWFVACNAAIRFANYAELIKHTRDGQAMNRVAFGLLLVALSLPLGAVVAAAGNYFVYYHQSLSTTMLIITNYFNLFILVWAFSRLFSGSAKLASLVKDQANVANQRLGRLLFVIVSAPFVYLTMTNPARQFATASATKPAYGLPDWLLLFTIVLPYVLIWYAGILTTVNLLAYRTHIAGVLYRRSLNFLAAGMGITTIAFLLTRYLSSLTTLFTTRTLQFLLLVVYILLVIIAIGFGFVNAGARRLRKIEEA